MEPVLRGHIKFFEDGRTVWDGRWGMTAAAFEEENAELLNSFRYTCATSRALFGSGEVISFRGYFEVSAVGKGSKSQFTDKQLDLQVLESSSEPGNLLTVKGHGSNRFGNFDIRGSFNPSTSLLEVRRIYAPKPIQIPRSSRKAAALAADNNNDNTSNNNLTPKQQKVSSQPQSPSSPAEVLVSSSTSSSSLKPSETTFQPQQPDVVTTSVIFDSSFYSEAKAILKELKAQDVNKWFSFPVDAEALGLKDYHGIVKDPMDLGTIQAKLDGKLYSTWDQCLGDMRLTFLNALRYNNRYSTVYKAASDLNDFLESRIGKGRISPDNTLAGSSVGKRAHKKKKFFEPGDYHHHEVVASSSVVKKTPKASMRPLPDVSTAKKSTKKLNFSKVKRIKMSSSLDESLIAALGPLGPPLGDDDEEGVDSFDELDEDVFLTPPPSDDEADLSIDDTPLSTIPLIPDYDGYGTMSPTNLGDADDF